MDLKLWNIIAAVLVVLCLGTKALSLPQADLTDDDKIEPQSNDVDEDRRATWLDTRELEGDFKQLVYVAIQELAMEGKLDASVLKAPGLPKDKRNRWQGFCFRRTKSGRYLPYICWKGKGK